MKNRILGYLAYPEKTPKTFAEALMRGLENGIRESDRKQMIANLFPIQAMEAYPNEFRSFCLKTDPLKMIHLLDAKRSPNIAATANATQYAFKELVRSGSLPEKTKSRLEWMLFIFDQDLPKFIDALKLFSLGEVILMAEKSANLIKADENLSLNSQRELIRKALYNPSTAEPLNKRQLAPFVPVY